MLALRTEAMSKQTTYVAAQHAIRSEDPSTASLGMDLNLSEYYIHNYSKKNIKIQLSGLS